MQSRLDRIYRSLAGLLTVLLLTGGTAPAARAEQRLALVIGNAAYGFGRLANPANDAELMASTLEKVGFRVTKLIDADQKAMKKAMVEFGRSLRDTDSVGLFYYAGHGVQVDGENFLIPVGAEIRDENEVAVEAVALSEFLRTMERSAARVNIAILDACRNNPFGATSRSAAGGLARVDAPTGTIIAYSTAPGDVALDGTGANSPYTVALAEAIDRPGIAVEEVFKQTRRLVLASTEKKQTPWESSSLTGDFYFKAGAADNATAGTAPPPSVEDERLVEVKEYERIRDSGDAAALKAFIARFPEGSFAELVRLKLARLEPAAAAPSGTAETVTTNLDPNSPEGLFASGQQQEASGRPEVALKAYAAAANEGHSGAMASLAALYEDGRGTAQDLGEAKRLYRAAADKGDVRGLTGLAAMLEAGKGAARNEQEAVRLYRRAASLGSARALYSLGEMLRQGRGTPKDENEAFQLIGKAAGLDYPNAMHALGQMYESGRGVQRDLSEAVRWYQRGAEKGFAPAETALASLLELGQGAAKNLDEAVKLYRSAADAGDAEALSSLGYLYEQGKGVAQSYGEAMKLYQRAGEAGDARALYRLGAMLEAGLGTSADPAAAAELYRRAAERGYAAALRNLARMLDEGRGLPRDPAKAAELALEAFKLGHKQTRDELLSQASPYSLEARRAVQARLKQLGLFKGAADGQLGASTRSALQAYGKSN